MGSFNERLIAARANKDSSQTIVVKGEAVRAVDNKSLHIYLSSGWKKDKGEVLEPVEAAVKPKTTRKRRTKEEIAAAKAKEAEEDLV